MKKVKFIANVSQVISDTVTPVSIYLKLRSLYPNAILLESSDYHSIENSYSFICFSPLACFTVNNGLVKIELNNKETEQFYLSKEKKLYNELNRFLEMFDISSQKSMQHIANGIFGYMNYDAVSHFENIKLKNEKNENYNIPEVKYSFYKYVIAINHHKNIIHIIENIKEKETSNIAHIQHLIFNLNHSSKKFITTGKESSNVSDKEFLEMVKNGKEHCFRGDVFQIVLSRQYSQPFEGDDFNVYRALRSINPSPYLFYFDYGNYHIFGSSPEAQLLINKNTAFIHPIAGTFKRTGNDKQDHQLAYKLSNDPKENAEHVMLVDLARNDLSRNAKMVRVDTFKEVQFFSHVIHLVSQVSGKIDKKTNPVKVLGDTFPAGTLSGAPKYKAMQLINKYENQNRGYYGGCIGFIGFDKTVNQAITIRSFLSKNNKLFYQAGAGIVCNSIEENELQEVNNKLEALKKAIEMAADINL